MTRPVIGIDARYGMHSPRRGIGEYIYQLLRHLADIPRPYDLYLYADERADNETIKQFRSAFPIEILKAPNFFWWEQFAMPYAARSMSLIHGTANIGPLRTKQPLVLTVHDVIEWHRGKDFGGQIPVRHHLSRLYRMNALKYLVRKSSLIFTVSHHAAQDISATLNVPIDNIMVTPLAPKYQSDKIKWPKTPFVLVLGAMDPRKNLALVMKTAAMLVRQGVHFKVVGIESHHLSRMMQDTLVPDNVELCPMIDDVALADLYAEASCFVYPSLYEGFGLPILEAMSLGCPVITGMNSSLPEIGGDAAFYVNSRDPSHWADAIWQVITHPEQQKKLAERGQRRARQFHWQNTAQLTDDGYRRGLFSLGRLPHS
ncbi:MAG: glycosyltransferase family 1 protein [Sulfobacillus thermosulfidooxidans]|uniref:Glycosyltransferase family 1 protein n=1 Tax=Sulfobacillus thermosulfidooxidans TaxID=28034 RepID=A0A2T2X389_SULTH|nr:MAG: glycosyltransferase family 1 protein [Sulfobacillus thermosulfidooxidans]